MYILLRKKRHERSVVIASIKESNKQNGFKSKPTYECNLFLPLPLMIYPKLAENWSMNQVATTLASDAVTIIIMLLTYTRKYTSKHLSCIQVKEIMPGAT